MICEKGKNSHMQNQVTINQHYVPRFYMKPFSTVINEGTNKEKSFLSFYQFKNKILRDNVPITSICSEDYFYDEDGHVESKLAEKETIWAKIIRKINDGEEVSGSDINTIREFAIYQIIRTKAMLMHIQEMAAIILGDSLSNQHSELDKNVIQEMVGEKVKSEITPEFGLTIIKDLMPVVCDLDMVIIENKTAIPLITSDVPVIVTNPLGIRRAGLGDVGEVIFFPVSQWKLVMFYDNRFYGRIQKEVFDEETIHIINKYQYISADERILSLESSVFASYIENKELNEIRERFSSTPKTNTAFDGFGTFIAAKSRSLEYFYNIPILKLPKQLRKIPKDFQETFPREYSYENRRALLCRIYRKPDFIKNEDQVLHWKKRQEYSKVLLNYLDSYWQTPYEDRVISGECMHKLQTVPVTQHKLSE